MAGRLDGWGKGGGGGDAYRLQEVRVGEVVEEGADAVAEGLVEDVEGGQEEDNAQVSERDAHQRHLAPSVNLLA